MNSRINIINHSYISIGNTYSYVFNIRGLGRRTAMIDLVIIYNIDKHFYYFMRANGEMFHRYKLDCVFLEKDDGRTRSLHDVFVAA